MWDMVKDIAMALVPPHDAEGAQIYKWRLVVAGALGGLIVATSIHIAWACGFLMTLGLPGFARADDMQKVSEQLAKIQVGQIRAEILLTRASQCQAIKSQNQQALVVITKDLQNALDTYQTLSNKQYPMPDCNAL